MFVKAGAKNGILQEIQKVWIQKVRIQALQKVVILCFQRCYSVLVPSFMESILSDKRLIQTAIGGIIKKILAIAPGILGERDSMTISIAWEPPSCPQDSLIEVHIVLTIDTDTEDITGDDDGN